VLFVLVGCATGQSKLARLAAEDDAAFVRRAAVEKLTDQALLAKIAVEDKAASVRRAAVEKLTDQALLAKIATEEKRRSVCHAAAERLTDQALLGKIATEEKRRSVRHAAAERLTDQALLGKIAVEDDAASVRRAAVEKLTDQALLAKIAVEDNAAIVRRAAVEKLTDQALLAKIATDERRRFVRRAALERLTGRAVKPIEKEAATPVTEEGPPKTEAPEMPPQELAEVKPPAEEEALTPQVTVEPEEVIGEPDKEAEIVAGASSERPWAPEMPPQELAEVKPPAEEEAPTPQVTVEPEEVIGEPDKEAEIVAGASSERPSAPEMPPGGTFTINLASFRQKQKADLYVEELKKLGIHAYSWEVNLPEKGRWNRVSVGGFPTLKEARNYTKQLRQKGISDSFIIKITKSS
jgi:cell division septation protein DedD